MPRAAPVINATFPSDGNSGCPGRPSREPCSRVVYHKDLLGILIAIVVLIVYGSLYPWAFEVRHLSDSPLYILFHSWDGNVRDRRFLFDVAVNIAIYVPLGATAYLASRRIRHTALHIVLPIALGALLSASMEMLQLFTPHRQCSSVDLVDNILGSAVGVFAGFIFTQIVDAPLTGPKFHVRDRGATALLFCWVAFLVFPLFPALAFITLRTKCAALFQAPVIDLVPILLTATEWLAVGRLLVAAGARSPLRWLCVLLLLVPAQFMIVNRSPMPSDFVGAALAVLLFHFFGKEPIADRRAGVALLVAVMLRGLAPFHFEGPGRLFLWIPFASLLGAEWQNAIVILAGKLFQYGASIWLLHRGGVRLVRATVLVTLVLAGIEALQTRIPSHVPEITDPLLAVLLCMGLSVLDRHPEPEQRRFA